MSKKHKEVINIRKERYEKMLIIPNKETQFKVTLVPKHKTNNLKKSFYAIKLIAIKMCASKVKVKLVLTHCSRVGWGCRACPLDNGEKSGPSD